MPLTKRQSEIFNFIADYITKNGYAPSLREIGKKFKLASVATVYQHIETLRRKGYLKKQANQARSIEIAEGRTRWGQAVDLPLVGTIAAGEPIEAIEDNETICVPVGMTKNPEKSFVLKVRGDSMIDDGILDGDFVVCERNYSPPDGSIVVALLNNEYATLKRFFRTDHFIKLMPANKRLKPIYAKNPSIRGIVTAVIRKYGK